MKHKTIIVLLIACSFLLAGCSDGPERAAKQWFDAMLNMDGNKILDRTCGLNIESQGDVSGLKFSTTSLDTEKTVAHVHVSGEIRVAVLALAQAYPIDETWLMVKEDGVWRWCGIP
jgi:hypothetical protein